MDAASRQILRENLAGARTCSASVLFAALDRIEQLEAALVARRPA